MADNDDSFVPLETFEGQFHDRYIKVGGLRLHYTEWNATGADVMVLLHGINVQAHTWDPIAARLSDRYRVICPDLRGHGDSDWTEQGYGVQLFVADLRNMMVALGCKRFVLVGHSLGARIAIAFAGEHSSMLSHLLLSDAGPELPKSTAQSTTAFVANTNNTKGFRSRGEVREHYARAHAEWKEIFVNLHAQYQVRLNWANKYVLKADPELYWITRGVGVREVPYLWEMASKAKVPTLIMRGVRSEFLNQDIMDRMIKTMPDATVETFETGHYIPRESPDDFLKAVTGFLAKR